MHRYLGSDFALTRALADDTEGYRGSWQPGKALQLLTMGCDRHVSMIALSTAKRLRRQILGLVKLSSCRRALSDQAAKWRSLLKRAAKLLGR